MDLQTKTLLGKILGEVYVTRLLLMKANVIPQSTDITPQQLFGLLYGIENAIDYFSTDLITVDQVESVGEILEPINSDPKKLAEFKWYPDPTAEADYGQNLFDRAGIDRSTAMHILTYFKAASSYNDVIDKMIGGDGSFPTEFTGFDLPERISDLFDD